VITDRRASAPATRFFRFASLGDAPQDKKYKGEPTLTRNRRPQRISRIRHGESRHHPRQRVTPSHDNLLGRIRTWLMTAVSRPDRDGECATLGGHVEIGDWATLGGLSPVQSIHQGRRALFHAHNAMGDSRRSALCSGGGTPGGAAQRQRDRVAAAGFHPRADPEQYAARTDCLVPLGLKLKMLSRNSRKRPRPRWRCGLRRIHQAQRTQHRPVA